MFPLQLKEAECINLKKHLFFHFISMKPQSIKTYLGCGKNKLLLFYVGLNSQKAYKGEMKYRNKAKSATKQKTL